MLDKLNRFEKQGRIFTRESTRDFEYSDGPDIELYLKTVLENAEDLSSVSVELERAIQDWATEYHLSSKRANLLRGFDFEDGIKVLELGCGCGAITRFLGEQGAVVDAVEGSPVRAELAALRCRSLDNVSVYCSNFNDLELPEAEYDLVCLVGVAEYAARFMHDHGGEPAAELLRGLKKVLKPGGVMLVAIENRAGMKYMLGAHEDHYAKRFIGIDDYFGEKDINTYTLPEWRSMFESLDVADAKLYLPFPDYKIPTVLLSGEFVRNNPHFYCNLEGVLSRDYVDLFKPGVNESLLWQAVAGGGSAELHANSFLFLLSFGDAAVGEPYRFDFAHLPGFGRHREYCLITVKPEGEDLVKRRKLIDRERDDSFVSQRVIDEPYHSGKLLSVAWARALEIEPESGRFLDLVSRYLEFIKARTEASIDLTPSNIVVDQAGSFHAFDEEWVTSVKPPPDFLLFRALLMLASGSTESLRRYAVLKELETVRQFIVYIGDQLGVDLAARLDEYVELEERFQNAIQTGRSENRTTMLLDRAILEDPGHIEPVKLRLYWRKGNGPYTEEQHRYVYVDVSDDRQTARIVLPPDAGSAEWIRFNPGEWLRDDGVGFMRLYTLEIMSVDGRSRYRDTIWSMATPDEIAENATMKGIRYSSSGMGSVFMVTAEDPSLEFEFIPRGSLSADRYLELEVELTMPRTREYLLARDRYATVQERLEEKRRAMEDLCDSHMRIREELAAIKDSNFWKALGHYRAFRGGLREAAGKIRLWRAMLRNLGPKRTLARAYRQAGKRAAALAGRRPEDPGPPTRYEVWRDVHASRETRAIKDGPLISVVMPVRNVDGGILQQAVDSVRRQTYGNWELCIADDASTRRGTLEALNRLDGGRIKVTRLPENRNISAATNAAADLASGDYLAFMDNDDQLPDNALHEVASAILDTDAELVYTDEDFIKTDHHLDHPHFKPDYSPDLLLSHNYITHLLVLKTGLFNEIGGLRSAYDGAQDYDLVLRAVEKASRIVHVPKPLYHWRMSETSTSVNPTIKPAGHGNAKRALEETLRRRGVAGTVEETRLPHYFRVKREIRGSPLVSIIVPFRDKPELLRRCVASVVERTTYPDIEVIGVSNDSWMSPTYDAMEELRRMDDRVSFLEHNSRFNFSTLVNFGVEKSGGAHVLLLNNDIEIITPEWVEGLLEHSQRSEIAAVGGKLYYPNNRIQHAGLAIGLGGYAGHLHSRFRGDSPGYFNRLNVIQNVSAVTGAMMMVERKKYEELGGFDEKDFGIAYNDVDFCLRAMESGYLNIFTPYAEAYHHESMSRGYEDTADKKARFNREKANLRTRHGGIIERGDPYYNPNFDQNRDDFTFRVEPHKTRA